MSLNVFQVDWLIGREEETWRNWSLTTRNVELGFYASGCVLKRVSPEEQQVIVKLNELVFRSVKMRSEFGLESWWFCGMGMLLTDL